MPVAASPSQNASESMAAFTETKQIQRPARSNKNEIHTVVTEDGMFQ